MNGSDDNGVSYGTSIFSATPGTDSQKITLTAITPGIVGNSYEVATPSYGFGHYDRFIYYNNTITTYGSDATGTKQTITYTPENISAGTYVLRMAVAGKVYSQKVSSGSTIQSVVEALQSKITLDPPSGVSCSEDDIKITCIADVAGATFTHSAYLANASALHEAINAEYSDGEARTTLALNQTDYTPVSWTSYYWALGQAMDMEADYENVIQENLNYALINLNNAIAALILDPTPSIISTSTGVVAGSNSGAFVLTGSASKALSGALVVFTDSAEQTFSFTLSGSDIAETSFTGTFDLSTAAQGAMDLVVTPFSDAYTGSVFNETLLVDSVGPTLAEVTPISTFTKDNTPSVLISSTELANITLSGSCQASGLIQFGGGNNTLTFDALSNGLHDDCYLVAVDRYGNTGSTLHLSPFTVDTLAPTGEITSLTDGQYLRGTVNLTATGSDIGGAGIAKVEFWYYSLGTKIGEDTTAPYSMTWDTSTGIV